MPKPEKRVYFPAGTKPVLSNDADVRDKVAAILEDPEEFKRLIFDALVDISNEQTELLRQAYENVNESRLALNRAIDELGEESDDANRAHLQMVISECLLGRRIYETSCDWLESYVVSDAFLE